MAGDTSEPEADERAQRRSARQKAVSQPVSRAESPADPSESGFPSRAAKPNRQPSPGPPTDADAKRTGDIFRRLVSGRARLTKRQADGADADSADAPTVSFDTSYLAVREYMNLAR